MNIAYKNMYALVFSVALTAPLYSMESEGLEAVQQSVVAWYKKPEVKLAAAVTTAVAGYAFAARMGRVAVPAFVVTLCALVLGSKRVEASGDAQNVQNNDNVIEPTAIPVQNTQDQITFNSVTKQLVDTCNVVVATLKNTTLDQYQDAAAQIDYQDIDEKRLA